MFLNVFEIRVLLEKYQSEDYKRNRIKCIKANLLQITKSRTWKIAFSLIVDASIVTCLIRPVLLLDTQWRFYTKCCFFLLKLQTNCFIIIFEWVLVRCTNIEAHSFFTELSLLVGFSCLYLPLTDCTIVQQMYHIV